MNQSGHVLDSTAIVQNDECDTREGIHIKNIIFPSTTIRQATDCLLDENSDIVPTLSEAIAVKTIDIKR